MTIRAPVIHTAVVACCNFIFFLNDTATTEIYTLSLHDALPISVRDVPISVRWTNHLPSPSFLAYAIDPTLHMARPGHGVPRSEEHTSELQSPCNLVCRLLLEKEYVQIILTIGVLLRTTSLQDRQ